MFRFIPTIREEYKAIRGAMRLRDLSWRNPMEMLEYRMVPLLTGLVTIGNELSTSALTRGLIPTATHKYVPDRISLAGWSRTVVLYCHYYLLCSFRILWVVAKMFRRRFFFDKS